VTPPVLITAQADVLLFLGIVALFGTFLLHRLFPRRDEPAAQGSGREGS
jgi:hypothetical protein